MTWARRTAWSAAACALTVAIPDSALAESTLGNDSNAVSYQPPPAERRDGFVFGLVQHLGMGQLSGYPNRLAVLGDPEYRATTGTVGGQVFGLWLGGALRDWLTVGVGINTAATFGEDKVGGLSAFVLHLEGYPAYSLGGAYRDLGVALDVGTGGGQILEDKEVLADGGSLAYFAGSVFFEHFRFWRIANGPSLTYSHAASQTLTAHTVGLGWRFVFYGAGPD